MPYRMAQNGDWFEEVRIPMWLEILLQGFMDVAQSKRVSRPVRIICVTLISLVFLTGITSLFLLVFIIEGQSFLRRGVFLIMGMAILAYYLQFLKTIVCRRIGVKKP